MGSDGSVSRVSIWGTFDVYTDNNPLTYVFTSAKLDAMGQRWIANLANYTFQLYYKSGKANGEADALSRIRHENYTQVMPEVVKAITSAAQLSDLTDFVPKSETVIAKSVMAATQRMTNAQWKK